MSDRRRAKRLKVISYVGLGVLALATLGVVGAVALKPAPDVPVSEKVQEYYASQSTRKPTITAAAPAVKIDAGLLEPGTKTVVFGDSWTKGTGAAAPEQGYAYLTAKAFGWANTVMGEGGTGYQTPGPQKVGTFLERLNALPVDGDVKLVVMQGSINDQPTDPATFKDSVNTALDAAKVKFPQAQLVILGPAPSAVPASTALVRVDGDLGSVASQRGLPYVSPVAQQWITPGNYATIIDIKQASHPSTEGHAYLADQTVKALKALAG